MDGAIVGMVPTIISSMMVNGENRLRINVSSWYVDSCVPVCYAADD